MPTAGKKVFGESYIDLSAVEKVEDAAICEAVSVAPEARLFEVRDGARGQS